MNNSLEISKEVLELANECEKELKDIFLERDRICFNNNKKVLEAFIKNGISMDHFNGTNGYGYNDVGREKIDKVFSDVLGAEDALVRGQFVSGTHALTVCLFGLLRPGDTLLSIAFGVDFKYVDLVNNMFDIPKIKESLKDSKIKVVSIQRSKGYSFRKSISVSDMEKIIKEIRKVREDVIVMVDNCYCELVEEISPLEVGADIMVGSLIKNLGAGIAPNGGYIAGRRDLVFLAAERLAIPGEGKEIGATLDINRCFLQGIYLAPSAINSSVKTAILASKMLDKLGYEVEPSYDDVRVDIVQAIKFNDPEKMIKYCCGIQMASPIDAYVTPIPDDMPGYNDKIIMAAGCFVQGATIELSCDGPLREPYIAYQQGGLTYEYGKLGVLKAITEILK